MAEAYIVAAARTAGGRRGGRLSGWHPVELAAQVLDALLDRSGCDPAMVEDVIMGCVMQAGEQSTCVGRNAVLASRLPESVPGTSIITMLNRRSPPAPPYSSGMLGQRKPWAPALSQTARST